MNNIVLASAMAALIAWCICARLGLPIWTTWEVGDRFDFTVLTGLLTFYALKALTTT